MKNKSSGWINVLSSLPKEGTENIVVWCGWAMTAIYVPNEPRVTCWYEPTYNTPIFHVTHWRIILPPHTKDK